ncbi:pseudouridine synthase [Neolewinella lacunae]|uniref:RNA pseudouridine synthase n=1 Tax=Neolewinella lacunae TaxID=1517758 RepID=A0A923T6P9_9BACT|nr:RluA family pseudouridine synthase [Neolewinella lacunae]MBC6993655.1 RNA pseudouridine synthase [Neolewinella lacunae]MDN3634717.1 pseudouridine synthase [Neolewinella lacunae]
MTEAAPQFIPFQPPVPLAELPPRLNYPFHSAPHPLALRAAAELQQRLSTQTDWSYDFGQPGAIGAQGKMFGVLVVVNPAGEVGYLAAFSGKLADSNHLPGFVPPVYDVLQEDGFYKAGEQEVNALNARLEALENSPELAAARQALLDAEDQAATEIAAEKAALKSAKRQRAVRRDAQRDLLPPTDFQQLEAALARESVGQHFALKDLVRAWEQRLATLRATLQTYTGQVADLREQRKVLSHALQHRIFEQYRFLDAEGRERDLPDIFRETIFQTPPAGAGECAAPKLLQYAYRHGLRPVTMAEFWWGQSPASEIRKHGNFYPACRGKCEPILGHMLQGLSVEPNPLLQNPAVGKSLTVVYEDDDLLLVNKPHEMLSVPGKNIEDSVWLRAKKRYPSATGPLIVHRLDMSTSGLLLLTKNKETHKLLQHQFFKRSVQKRYIALLEGVVDGEEGTIDLPLRGDLEDRPRQIVCTTHGKTARTHWKVIGREGKRTLVHLWPVTGRTHQLRVHAAHPGGLNAPIVGDDLYGVAASRLCLHAEWIAFTHPTTRQAVAFEVPVIF